MTRIPLLSTDALDSLVIEDEGSQGVSVSIEGDGHSFTLVLGQPADARRQIDALIAGLHAARDQLASW